MLLETRVLWCFASLGHFTVAAAASSVPEPLESEAIIAPQEADPWGYVAYFNVADEGHHPAALSDGDLLEAMKGGAKELESLNLRDYRQRERLREILLALQATQEIRLERATATIGPDKHDKRLARAVETSFRKCIGMSTNVWWRSVCMYGLAKGDTLTMVFPKLSPNFVTKRAAYLLSATIVARDLQLFKDHLAHHCSMESRRMRAAIGRGIAFSGLPSLLESLVEIVPDVRQCLEEILTEALLLDQVALFDKIMSVLLAEQAEESVGEYLDRRYVEVCIKGGAGVVDYVHKKYCQYVSDRAIRETLIEASMQGHLPVIKTHIWDAARRCVQLRINDEILNAVTLGAVRCNHLEILDLLLFGLDEALGLKVRASLLEALVDAASADNLQIVDRLLGQDKNGDLFIPGDAPLDKVRAALIRGIVARGNLPMLGYFLD